MQKIVGAILGTFLSTLAVMPAANATVITTGTIELRVPHTGGFSFDFLIDGLSVTGFADEGSKYFSASLYEGDTFNGNQDNRAPNDLFYGFAGSEFALWRLGNDPFATLLDTQAAGSVLTRGQTVYTSTFDFQGQLCGIKQQFDPCFVTYAGLTGQGIAEFFFNESVLDDGRHFFTPTRATYTFMPVPEPETLALFGAGLLGIFFARRRRA